MDISHELRSALLGKFNYFWGGPTQIGRDPGLDIFASEMNRTRWSGENRYLSTRISEALGGAPFNTLKIREFGLAEELEAPLVADFHWVGAVDPEGKARQETALAEARQNHIESRIRQLFGLEQPGQSFDFAAADSSMAVGK